MCCLFFVCRVGELLAQRAVAAGIDGVSWQRKQGQKYHGRVASLITQMQDSGLKLV
jgi:ribosomal protein L18